jgi:hypothetical protein
MKDPCEGRSRGGIGGEFFVESCRGRHVFFGQNDALLVGTAGKEEKQKGKKSPTQSPFTKGGIDGNSLH